MLHNRFILYLIRHGQSEVNAMPDMIGQAADTPLTELGRRQAAALSTVFDQGFWHEPFFQRVYASDYVRAVDTANIALNNAPITVCPELREYSAGDWAFQSRKTIITPEVQLNMAHMGSAFLPPNGESLHQVERRASKWLEDHILYNQEVIDESQSHQKAYNGLPFRIGIFSHGMTIKCLLHYVMGFDQAFTWRIDLDNTSITTLSFGETGWRLLGVNDTAHLNDLSDS